MAARLKSIRSNLKKVDAHVLTREEYEELPELTDDMFARAVYKVGGIVRPVRARKMRRKLSMKKRK